MQPIDGIHEFGVVLQPFERVCEGLVVLQPLECVDCRAVCIHALFVLSKAQHGSIGRAVLVGALELQGGLEHVLVWRGNRLAQCLGVVVDHRKHAQAKEKQQACKHDAKEQRHKMTGVARKNAHPKARDVAQPLGQTRATVAPASGGFVAQELQRSKAQVSQQAYQRDTYQQQVREDGGYEHNARVPNGAIGREAVAVIVQVLKGVAQHAHAQGKTGNRGKEPNDDR